MKWKERGSNLGRKLYLGLQTDALCNAPQRLLREFKKSYQNKDMIISIRLQRIDAIDELQTLQDDSRRGHPSCRGQNNLEILLC